MCDEEVVVALAGEVSAFPVFTVAGDAPVIVAARAMRDRAIGDVVVVDDDSRLAGLLTDRDLVVRVMAEGRDAETTIVREVCTPDPVAIDALAPVEEAERLMRDHLVHRLPVIDDKGHPIGLLSLEDLAASGYIADHELREVMKSIARAYQLRSAAIP
jgi:CBS domain-containing protein